MNPATTNLLGQGGLSPLDLGFALILAASVGLWIEIGGRLRRKEPVLPYEARRPVPWGGIHLVVVLSLFVVVVFLLQPLGDVFGTLVGRPEAAPAEEGVEAAKPAVNNAVNNAVKKDGSQRQHPLVVALRANHSAAAVLVAIYAAVLGAPVAEEFFFRLLLQGWLEKLERRGRRRLRLLRWLTVGVLPVLAASSVFAAPHLRKPEPIEAPDLLLPAIAVDATARLATVALAVWLLRTLGGATARDLGFVPARFWADVRLGLLAFLAIGIPTYWLQNVLEKVLPENVIPDPITLFFFAAVLGLLYYRTHRIVSAITLHMALNATSIALVLLDLAD